MPSSTNGARLAGRLGGTAAGGRPWLVWLHGLFGSGDDWQALLPGCAEFPCLTLDLPGHGRSRAIDAASLAEVDALLSASLQHHGIGRYWLIGYSLGGRIACYHATRGGGGAPPAGLCGLIVEAAHPGLGDEAQRAARCAHDHGWAQRLRCEPLAQVLDDWYRQPLFADLDSAQRAAMVARRGDSDGARVAMLLEACSLGRQAELATGLNALTLPFAYLCGTRDAKFQDLARRHHFPLHLIGAAGHNAHAANPDEYAATLQQLLNRRN